MSLSNPESKKNSGIKKPAFSNILFLDPRSLLISLRENVDSAQKWSDTDLMLLVTSKMKFFRDFTAEF